MKKKALDFLPAAVFVVFIAVMLILFIVLPKKDYSSSEKRYLADFPDISSDSFFSGKFGKDFEVYLSDHTVMRNFWVGLDAYYNLAIGNKESNGIYHCDDSYLINDPCDTSRLFDNIDTICEFTQGRERKTVVMVAPSTGYIVSDKLPYDSIKYNDDELFDKMRKQFNKNGICFADVREAFKKDYASGSQIYYKTDHHWTSRGAFDAYTVLGESLGYTPNCEDVYTIEKYDGFYGTTYSSSGYWLNDPDTIELWQMEKSECHTTVTISDGDNTITNDGMFFYDRLEEDDKYPVFLDGNHPYTEIRNITQKLRGNNKKLLVIKDSFAHSLVPFLADHYSTIVMVDLRYYKQSISQLIDENNFSKILFVYSIDNLATDSDIAWLQ